MKLHAEKEKVIVRGIRPEEQLWGAYQFPTPYRTEDGIVCSVHITDDSIKHFRGDTKRWFKSTDGGESWFESDAATPIECGILLENGDRLFFPQVGSEDVSQYSSTHLHYRTPASDMKSPAPEGVLPLPDGMSFDMSGALIYAYDADRLPPSLSKKQWLALRQKTGETTPKEEYAQLDWPRLTRVVFSKNDKKVMRSVFPHGRARLGPDGAIWISTYSGDGHIDPNTGLYNQYYSAEILRSEDNGHSFKLYAHMEYPADGTLDYPYSSGGFSDNDFEFTGGDNMVWIFRSAWFARTGLEWSPMYISHSSDMGKSWTKPKPFTPTGVYPSICKLKCGVTLLCYARPGVFVIASEDGCKSWSEPLEIMTADDRSGLANQVAEKVKFHDWDGACNNPQLLALDDNSALLFYSDFYYPDSEGVKRKTILCKKITVEK